MKAIGAVALAFACIAITPRPRAAELAVDVLFADRFETALPTVFRIGAIALRDPHVFVALGPLCIDSTAELNGEFQSDLDADQDGDGFYDASALAVFRPFDTSGAPGRFENQSGLCTTALPSQCTPGSDAPIVRWYQAFDAAPADVCLGILPDTTSGYDPPIAVPSGQCFSTAAADASFALGSLAVPLWDTQFAAPLPAPIGSTGGGLVRGFLREADADALMLDFDGVDVALSSLLPDGSGSCARNVAHGKDTDRDEPGWWMYLEYRLDAVSPSGF